LVLPFSMQPHGVFVQMSPLRQHPDFDFLQTGPPVAFLQNFFLLSFFFLCFFLASLSDTPNSGVSSDPAAKPAAARLMARREGVEGRRPRAFRMRSKSMSHLSSLPRSCQPTGQDGQQAAVALTLGQSTVAATRDAGLHALRARWATEEPL
jgi:hypothetical protein